MKHAQSNSRMKKLVKKSSYFRKKGLVVFQTSNEDVIGIVFAACSKFPLDGDQKRDVLGRVLGQVPGRHVFERSKAKSRSYGDRLRENKRAYLNQILYHKRIYSLAEQVAREVYEVHSRENLERLPSPSEQQPRMYFDTRPAVLLISNRDAPCTNLVQMCVPVNVNRALDYPNGKVRLIPTSVSAAELADCPDQLTDINITRMDAPITELAKAKILYGLKSLNMSRLDLTDDMVSVFFESACLKNLRWLDLSGNRCVSELGVRSICKSVKNGSLTQLDWLNLTGTSFDATPYVDGHYWRISNNAKKLAQEYGFQRWMMLGSQIPELENHEVLTTSETSFPPGMFRSA